MSNSTSRKTILARALLSGALALSLSSCGGGGSGGGGGGGGTSPSPSPSPTPTPTPTPAPQAAAKIVFAGSGDSQTTLLFRVDDNAVNGETLLSESFSDGARILDFAISPDGKWVAFIGSRDRGTPISLYAVPIDGGSPVKISQNSDQVRNVDSFEWSPDSRRIIYDGNLGQGLPAINTRETFVVDPTGANHSKVSGSVGNPPIVEVRNPTWSPDATRILTEVASVDSTGEGDPNAFQYNVYEPGTGTGFVLIKSSGGILRGGRWGGDSRKVCYSIRPAGATQFRLQYSTADASGPRHFAVSPLATFNSSCRWNSQANEIVYFEQAEVGAPGQLKHRSLVTGIIRTLADLSASGQGLRSYEYRPGDDERIAFIANLDNVNSYELYLSDLSETSPERIGLKMTGGRDTRDFKWSPDGMRIAYRADTDGDGLIELVILDIANFSNRVVNLESQNVIDYAWSPDSERLVFSGGTDDTGSDVYTLRPSSLSFVRNSSPNISVVRGVDITTP